MVPELDHIYCCNPDLALCGTDISTMGYADHQQATCVVCVAATATTPVEGFITAIEVSSGAVGNFAVALDTGAIPSIFPEGASSGLGMVVARQKTCEYTLATVDTNKGSCGVREYVSGAPFFQGLTICSVSGTIGVTSAAEVTVRFRRIKVAK